MFEKYSPMDPIEADIAAVAGIDAVPAILDVICRTTGMGFAAVARVTEDRWIACSVKDNIAFGLKAGGELLLETTICQSIRATRKPVVINHVAEDPAYRDHRTPATYGFQSYISMPVTLPGGSFFGTLCAIDPRPARVNSPEVVGMFRLFAELIAFHLDSHYRIERARELLSSEREAGQLREQFIAVMAHDLRNPLASIDAGARMLLGTQQNEKARGILQIMQGSVLRMSGLIDNVLDFARGRLGGGITLDTASGELPLGAMLEQVLSELRTAFPDRRIDARIDLEQPPACDRLRIGQLFSNLIGNALTHGDPDQPIRVEATAQDGTLTLAVANAGQPITDAARARLFQPFFRGSVVPSQQGLGLGLYIADEIARAHGGTLEVASNDRETCFTFRMGEEEGK